ncbi:MAG: hypothetical protein M1837_005179 [Sclerophora amabilis]|nr:MAG: hypothetical protein M1837_005179 [Sclerophora amabilis]
MDDADRISITVCGDGGCGKSSITLRLVRSEWTYDYDPTIGNSILLSKENVWMRAGSDSLTLRHALEDSYSVTRHVDGRTYFLSLTDTAGQEEYRGLWAASNLKSDAFLLVYDITNPESLANLDHFVQMIEMESESRMDAGGVTPVKIVAGNKCDLAGMRQVKSVQGLEYARRHGCGFMETSARNTVNIEETFALLVRRVVEQRRAKHSANTSISRPQLPSNLSYSEKRRHQQEQRLNSVDLEDRPGNKTKRGGFWARLKCW